LLDAVFDHLLGPTPGERRGGDDPDRGEQRGDDRRRLEVGGRKDGEAV
jgi:hypothetical protein